MRVHLINCGMAHASCTPDIQSPCTPVIKTPINDTSSEPELGIVRDWKTPPLAKSHNLTTLRSVQKFTHATPATPRSAAAPARDRGMGAAYGLAARMIYKPCTTYQ